ncbi:MAG: hypothetical protein NVS3B11_20820 [Collimonas sp.]
MREVDDAAQVKDQGKAKRHERIKRADDDPVEDVEDDEFGHARLAEAVHPFGRVDCKMWPGWRGDFFLSARCGMKERSALPDLPSSGILADVSGPP